MKTQTRKKPTTQYVAITSEIQLTNLEVEKAYTSIVSKASQLLKKFDLPKFRTYCEMEHTKNELNANLVKEFLSYHWNVTLSMNPKDGKLYIFIDLGGEALEKFGNGLTNALLREAYQLTQSHDNTQGIEYALRVNFNPSEQLHNFYYRRIVEGETDYVSIVTVDREVA